MLKKIVGIIAVAIALGFNHGVFADHWQCKEGIEKMVKQLNLSAEQKTKIKPIMDQLKTTIKETASQFNDLEKRIKDQVHSPSMDTPTVNSLIDKKAVLIGDMMKAKATAMNQVFNILDNDQKGKLQKMMDKFHEEMAEKYKSCQEDD